MEYFGCKTSFGELLNKNFGKKQMAFTTNSVCRAASSELHMTKIGQAVLKLFDSTFKLEIHNPSKRGGLET
jgi:hypothetical protein